MGRGTALTHFQEAVTEVATMRSSVSGRVVKSSLRCPAYPDSVVLSTWGGAGRGGMGWGVEESEKAGVSLVVCWRTCYVEGSINSQRRC